MIALVMPELEIIFSLRNLTMVQVSVVLVGTSSTHVDT